MRKPEPQVSEPTINRLAYYLRAVSHLAEAGCTLVSSQILATRLGVSSAQVRKDLSCFGEFGTQGQGYAIPALREQLSRILHVDDLWAVALVGAGKVGRALAGYDGLGARGFYITAIFDNDPRKVGRTVGKLPIRSTSTMAADLQQQRIELAILTVPADQAQEMAEQLVAAGVRAILNYTPTDLNLSDEITVENVDPVIHLQRMTFRLRQSAWPSASKLVERLVTEQEEQSKSRHPCVVPIKRSPPTMAQSVR